MVSRDMTRVDCMIGDITNLEEVLKGKSQSEIYDILHLCRRTGDFPLYLAIVGQRDLVVERLLDLHVDITMQNSVTGETALHVAGEISRKFHSFQS